MDVIVSLGVLLGALALGAMSPGPSFVLVARTAIARSRLEGLAGALGMGIGGAIFSILVLLGFQVVLAGVPWFYMALRVVGGAYLVYLGFCIWQGATKPFSIADTPQPAPNGLSRSFVTAIGVQLSNPKTAVFYSSVFAALLPRELPSGLLAILPVLVFVVEVVWYSIVAMALSSTSPRAWYLRAKTSVDRVAAGLLSIVGIKLVTSSVSMS